MEKYIVSKTFNDYPIDFHVSNGVIEVRTDQFAHILSECYGEKDGKYYAPALASEDIVKLLGTRDGTHYGEFKIWFLRNVLSIQKNMLQPSQKHFIAILEYSSQFTIVHCDEHLIEVLGNTSNRKSMKNMGVDLPYVLNCWECKNKETVDAIIDSLDDDGPISPKFHKIAGLVKLMNNEIGKL